MSPLLYVRYVYKLTDFNVRIQIFTRSRRVILELLLAKLLLLLLLLPLITTKRFHCGYRIQEVPYNELTNT
jgi:hypothetical protein